MISCQNLQPYTPDKLRIKVKYKINKMSVTESGMLICKYPSHKHIWKSLFGIMNTSNFLAMYCVTAENSAISKLTNRQVSLAFFGCIVVLGNAQRIQSLWYTFSLTTCLEKFPCSSLKFFLHFTRFSLLRHSGSMYDKPFCIRLSSMAVRRVFFSARGGGGSVEHQRRASPSVWA